MGIYQPLGEGSERRKGVEHGYMVAAIASGRPLRTGLELASYFAGGEGHCFGGG